jgi:hypothetical protein
MSNEAIIDLIEVVCIIAVIMISEFKVAKAQIHRDRVLEVNEGLREEIQTLEEKLIEQHKVIGLQSNKIERLENRNNN